MKTIEGNLLKIDDGIIAHQVNCRNAFGAGLAGQIGYKWPHVKEEYHTTENKILGNVSISRATSCIIVAHCFSQDMYGNAQKTGQIYTDYDAVKICFTKLAEIIEAMTLPIQIYVPCGYGCGLAGGNWKEVSKLISDIIPNIIAIKLGN